MRGNTALHRARCRVGNVMIVTSRRSLPAILLLVAAAFHLPEAAWSFCPLGGASTRRVSLPPQPSRKRGSSVHHNRAPSPSCALAAATTITSASSSPPTSPAAIASHFAERGGARPGGQGGKTGPYDWSFLDAVYLITCPNADPDSVRLDKARGILSDLGLSDRLVVKEFDTDDEDRIRGCYDSHISVIRDARDDIRRRRRGNNNGGSSGGGAQKQQQEWWKQLLPFVESDTEEGTNGAIGSDGANRKSSPTGGGGIGGSGSKVLILEDNLEYFGNLRQSSLGALDDFASRGKKEWNMIHLSYIPYVPNLLVSKTADQDIVKLSCGIGSALGTTAYIINDSGMDGLLEEDKATGGYSGAAIPDVMAKLYPDTRFASHPVPFLRAPQTPSLVNPQLDDLRSVLFQPGVVSAVQSIFVTTGLGSNSLFASTVGSLLVVAGLAGRVTVDAGMQLVETGAYEGNIVLPVVGSVFSLCSLGVLAFGAAIAPKPPSDEQPEAVAE